MSTLKKQLLKSRISVSSITELTVGQSVVVGGWVLFSRRQQQLVFVKLSDSAESKFAPLQVIFKKSDYPEAFDTLEHLCVGYSLLVKGTIVLSPAKGQKFEMQAEQFVILGKVDQPSLFPSAKAELTTEYTRSTVAHLECHLPFKAAIYSTREKLMRAIERFFVIHKYGKRDMPLITFSECEGGCQPMQATLFLTSGKLLDIPMKDDKSTVDFTKDFFGTKASLTVSAQLELETQLPLGDSWTVTRAIRGEPSQTTKHLCEFTMIELEKAFSSGSRDIIDITEKLIKYCIKFALQHCDQELAFLETKYGKPLRDTLKTYFETSFVEITHAEAITMIKAQSEKFTVIPSYEDDLSSEHEKFIVDLYKLPVVVKKYPKAVKAFYMPVVQETLEESHGVEHVDSFDILVPDVGELVGGSQRIDDIDELTHRIKELSLDEKALEFYIDLRRKGSIPHGGMGMGFERLIKFITGAESVKDCVPFPRYLGSGKSHA